MRRLLLLTSLIIFFSNLSFGQTIAFQDFEGGSDNWSFTPNPSVFNISGDVWDVVTSTFHTFNSIPSSGTSFWGIQDLNSPSGTTDFGTLTFASVDVSTYSSVQISFDYEVDGFDSGDDLKYEAFFDNVSQGEILLVDGFSNLDQEGSVTIDVDSGTNSVYLIVSIKQDGGSDFGSIDNFKVAVASAADPEPTNHATSFSAVANGHNQIDLSWADATGAQLPAGYLIKGSDVNFAAIAAPVDGTPEADAGLILNVAQGVETASFFGLTETTQYFFKIFSYTNAGANINYKTDGTVPQDDATTDAAPSLPNAWINEFHYDNDGADTDEFVEIIIENGSTYTLSDFQVNLYNGSGGASYNSRTLDTYTVGDVVNENGKTFNLYSFNYTNDGAIQNGGPDGIALSYQGTLIQFLSYEGTFTATDGPANGVSSADVGVTESGSTISGSSLGLEGTGTQYSDFTWTSFAASATPGSQNGSQALPVELTSFSATVSNKSVKLNWNTATELNNYGFEVQRYLEKENWENVGFVNGNGTSNSPKDYSFVDNKLSNSSSYFYRLKQVDNDGSFEFSKTIEVILGAPIAYKLDQNYPNPFNPATIISFTIPEDGFTRLTVFNSLGQKVKSLVNKNLEAGYHQFNFNAVNLTSGVYYYKLEAGNFVQINKMMLLK